MIGRTNAGAGGGGGLRVAVGLTAPANPRENMVWVKSAQAGKRYVFAASEPGSPAEGLIWFHVTSVGVITQADVYVGGVWVAADTFMYLSGAWVQIATSWDGTLFDAGNQYEAVTGGYTLTVFTLTDGELYTGFMSNKVAEARTVNKINVTKYNTLNIKCYSNISNSGGRASSKFGFHSGSTGNFAAYKSIDTNANTLKEYTLDISSLTGEYYFDFYANAKSMQGWAKIAKAWLT